MKRRRFLQALAAIPFAGWLFRGGAMKSSFVNVLDSGPSMMVMTIGNEVVAIVDQKTVKFSKEPKT